MQIDEASDGQQVALETGEVLQVDLNENPTTGFRWAVDSAGEPEIGRAHV